MASPAASEELRREGAGGSRGAGSLFGLFPDDELHSFLELLALDFRHRAVAHAEPDGNGLHQRCLRGSRPCPGSASSWPAWAGGPELEPRSLEGDLPAFASAARRHLFGGRRPAQGGVGDQQHPGAVAHDEFHVRRQVRQELAVGSCR